ncbi:MAG: site-specific integrase [Nitrospinaceae bacterium]|nr:site-specific integrase [Nitrospinaceae bacterium]
MPKKVIRKRGKRGICYAACRYRGILLQDSLETTDENLALQRLTQLKIQIDKGDYQSWKKTWSETEADYLKEDGRYEYIVRKHLRPFFSGKRIMEITNYDPKTGNSLVSEYFRVKGDLPESSLKKHARVMKWILQRGDRDFVLPAIIYRNKGFYQNQFMSILELDEIISLLEDQHQSLALVLAYTGLDLGDAVGLSWRDIDLQEQMIRTQRGKTGIKVDVPFTKAVSDVLQVRSRVRKLHDDRVFHTITGQGFQKAWKRALKKSSIEWNVRVKDLRHFFASFMLNNEVDHLTVVTLMGHTSVEMLKKRYGHFGDDTLRKAVKVFDKIESQSSNCLQVVCKS